VSVKLFSLAGSEIPLVFEDCSSESLAAGHSCIVSAQASGGGVVFEVVGLTKNLRGTCELFSTSGFAGDDRGSLITLLRPLPACRASAPCPASGQSAPPPSAPQSMMSGLPSRPLGRGRPRPSST